MKSKMFFFFLSPFILLGMGGFLLYSLVRIRMNRDRAYSVMETPGNSAAAKLKIAIVAKEFPPHISNLSSFTDEIARALVALGHQVHVVTMGGEESYLHSDGYWIHRIGSRIPSIFKYIKMAGFFETGVHLEHAYLIRRSLVALHKVHKFNVIEFPEACAEGVLYYFMRSKPPYVVRFHTSEGFAHQLSAKRFNLDRFWVRTMEKYWILKADAAIGSSKDIIKKYEFFYHLNLSGVPVISNPLDPEWFVVEKNQSIEKNLKILFVGRFALSKGPHILLQAIPKVLERSPHVSFVFVGIDGGLQKYCDEIVDNLGIAPNVTFLEQVPRDQMIDHYRNATVCVFPSQWDNFPYTCIEAMAIGCPVVASNVGGFTDIIENEVSGLLVEAGDADALAEAINKLLDDDELRDNIKINAPERVKSLCTARQVAESSLKVYLGVINK